MADSTPKLQYSAKFKRDYVAFSAVAIFFAVVIAEFVLAIGIPMRISASEIFPEQVRRQRMIDDFDLLRNLLERFRPKNPEVGEEARLLQWTNSRLGVYLRRHVNSLTRAEIEAVHGRVQGMLRIFPRLLQGVGFNAELDLVPGVFADCEALQMERIFEEDAKP